MDQKSEIRYCKDCLKEIPLTGRLWACFQRHELWLCRYCEKIRNNTEEINNGKTKNNKS